MALLLTKITEAFDRAKDEKGAVHQERFEQELSDMRIEKNTNTVWAANGKVYKSQRWWLYLDDACQVIIVVVLCGRDTITWRPE